MAEKKMMDRAGYEKLEKKLEKLKTVDRVQVAAELKEARSYGDLSENAEYDAAKDKQAALEAEITEIQYQLENAIIVDDISTDEIGIGSIFEIKRKGSTEIEKMKLVGTNDSNPLEGLISDESPIGKSAMKKRVGEFFLVEAPVGTMEYEVISISRE